MTAVYAIEWDTPDPFTNHIRPVRIYLGRPGTPLGCLLLDDAEERGLDLEVTKDPEDVCLCGADLTTCRPWAQCVDCHDEEARATA